MMNINIDVTSEELNEMGFDEEGLASHVVEALDGCVKELVSYDVIVNVDL